MVYFARGTEKGQQTYRVVVAKDNAEGIDKLRKQYQMEVLEMKTYNGGKNK